MILPDFGFGNIEAHLWELLFVMIRVGAAILAAPIFGAAGVPVQVRIILAGAIATFVLAWTPVTVPETVLSVEGMLMVVSEVMIGLAMGFVLQLAFAAPLIAAEIISGTMGMAIATSIDPNSGAQSGAMGQFFGIVLTLIFLGVGGHLLWLQLIVESYHSLPPGGGPFASDTAWQIAGFAARILATAVAIALPVTLVLLLIQMFTGVLSRSAPALNLFALGLPAGIMAGFAALIASFPLLTHHLVELSGLAIDFAAQVAAQ
jgi:flagellar biosynthetic protein FliR